MTTPSWIRWTLLAGLTAAMFAQAVEPETVELSFSNQSETTLRTPDPRLGLPAWIRGVTQTGGQFIDNPACWSVDETAPVGQGRLIVQLDRQRMTEDLALAVFHEAHDNTDLVVQLFDESNRVIVLDLFGNLIDVGREARTDTFIVPLRQYPMATKIVVRRINGPVRVFGLALYPVVTQADADPEALAALAKLLGDPLNPDSPVAGILNDLARGRALRLDRWNTRNTNGTAYVEGTASQPTNSDTGAAPVRKDGLVGYWSFDDGSARDASGNGHQGNVGGAPKSVPGVSGKALHFNGRDDWIKVPHTAALDLKDDLTVCAWVNYERVQGGFGSQVVWYGDPQPAHDPYEIHLLPDGTYQFRVDAAGGGDTIVADAPQRLAPGHWYFLAATLESLSANERLMKTYLDGQLVRVETLIGRAVYDTSGMWLMIGAVDHGNWQQYCGTIDEVRLYNRALPKTEIHSLFLQYRRAP